jgi:hypothetical protein
VPSALTYILDHVQLIGWPTLLLFIWRASRFITNVSERVVKAEQTIELLATNHLPHIEQGLKDVESAVERGFANLSNQLLIVVGRAAGNKHEQ